MIDMIDIYIDMCLEVVLSHPFQKKKNYRGSNLRLFWSSISWSKVHMHQRKSSIEGLYRYWRFLKDTIQKESKSMNPIQWWKHSVFSEIYDDKNYESLGCNLEDHLTLEVVPLQESDVGNPLHSTWVWPWSKETWNSLHEKNKKEKRQTTWSTVWIIFNYCMFFGLKSLNPHTMFIHVTILGVLRDLIQGFQVTSIWVIILGHKCKQFFFPNVFLKKRRCLTLLPPHRIHGTGIWTNIYYKINHSCR